MLDINLLREQPDIVRKAMQDRQMDPGIVDEVMQLDVERRQVITRNEALKAQRNVVSKEISKCQDAAERQQKIAAMRKVGDEISALDQQEKDIDEKLHDLVARIPNIPDESTPYGKDESENIIVETIGSLPHYDFKPLPHWALGPKLGIINFDQGTKLAGSRFYTLSGAGARLQRALIAWMLDLHIHQGYEEKYLPFMVKGKSFSLPDNSPSLLTICTTTLKRISGWFQPPRCR